MEEKRTLFLGIDLGGREKRTTGICIIENNNIVFSATIFGKELLSLISPFLPQIKVIAIDAPLTKGKGKGKMRLYEKFLSSYIFRKEKIAPIPPAFMIELVEFAREIVKKLFQEGFILDINLIETFPTFIEKACKKSLFLDDFFLLDKHQKAAFICAKVANLHAQFQTRYLGYKDGFLFLPEMKFWKKEWVLKFMKAWREKDRLRYRFLTTNLFD